MTGFLGRTALLICAGALLFFHFGDRDPDSEPTSAVLLGTSPAPAQDYMPLRPGRRMTYASESGKRFSLTFLEPVTLQWFDGTWRELYPVHDQRCGEYIVILPRDLSGPTQAVDTPVGSFERAVSYQTAGGTAWFAPGVGMIKTNEYRLIMITEPIAGRVSVSLSGRGAGGGPGATLRPNHMTQATDTGFARSVAFFMLDRKSVV